MSEDGGNNGILRIKIPWFDNLDIIARLKKTTLIGKVMNPKFQNMESLVSTMPKLWKLEGRVVGKSDSVLETFIFDFEREEDLLEVMKMEPFSFNNWMVSSIRWEKGVHKKNYPWAITFWVRIVGAPLRYSTNKTFRGIGEELGIVREVNEEKKMVKVSIDSTKPLCFEMVAKFGTGGEEIVVKMEYEKLFGYCGFCFSLCHDEESCPDLNQDDLEDEETY